VLVACSIASVQGVAWNANKAKLIQSLAWSSYCPFTVVKKWSCFWCTKPGAPKLTNVATVYNAAHDNFAYGGVDKAANAIFIVVRGTAVESVKDWIEDTSFTLVHAYTNKPSVAVHSGFNSGWGTLRAGVKQLISKLKVACPKCTLNLVGHSLGGGMATLAAVDLTRSGTKVNSLVTMGCPRVGNAQFAAYFGTLRIPSVRWVNKHDIVPHLPLTHLGYHHITQEFWSTDGTNFRQCSATNGEDPKCSDSILPIPFVGWSVTDHLKYYNVNLGDGKQAHCDGVYDNKS